MKLCAIGMVTSGELSKIGLQADYVPEEFTGGCLLAGLLKEVKPCDRILLVSAEMASREIPDGLGAAGVEFEEVKLYRTLPVSCSREGVINLFEQKKPDFVTFTSPSTVDGFASMVGADNLDFVSETKVICIGPVTAKAAEGAGLHVAGVAGVHTVCGVVDKILQMLEG
jgi:uroporphyrinogen III methyltransferase / synthase